MKKEASDERQERHASLNYYYQFEFFMLPATMDYSVDVRNRATYGRLSANLTIRDEKILAESKNKFCCAYAPHLKIAQRSNNSDRA